MFNRNLKVMEFVCNLCSKSFPTMSRLRRHSKQVHNEFIPLSGRVIKPDDAFFCKICNRSFTRKYSLKVHMDSKHFKSTEPKGPPKKRIPCFLKDEGCEFACMARKEYVIHLKEEHPSYLYGTKQRKQLFFSNFSDFQKWKSNEETENLSSYVLDSGRIKLPDKSVTYYRCHRSGVYQSRSSGIRKCKVQGSCKLGFSCPAYIKVEEFSDGSVFTVFEDVHLLHGQDLVHIRLKKEERELIAEQIKSETPLKVILENVRNSSKKSRLHLAQDTDVRNVARDFGLGKPSFKKEKELVHEEVEDFLGDIGLHEGISLPMDDGSSSSSTISEEMVRNFNCDTAEVVIDDDDLFSGGYIDPISRDEDFRRSIQLISSTFEDPTTSESTKNFIYEKLKSLLPVLQENNEPEIVNPSLQLTSDVDVDINADTLKENKAVTLVEKTEVPTVRIISFKNDPANFINLSNQCFELIDHNYFSDSG